MGCFVRGVKNGMGCFVPGCFVLYSFSPYKPSVLLVGQNAASDQELPCFLAEGYIKIVTRKTIT